MKNRHYFTKPAPAFRTKINVFLRIEVADSESELDFLQYCSSFGDICILPPSGKCTRSTRTSWSCTPWSKFSIQIF